MPPSAQRQLELPLEPRPGPAGAVAGPRGPVDGHFWPAIADTLAAALTAAGAPLRDSVLLLPTASLLPAVRAAFAQRGGWQPRIETTQTLADALGPPPPTAAGHLSGDAVTDRLTAAALLQRQREFAA